jgi:hypothetical protein
VFWNCGIEFPNIGSWNFYELREGAVAIDADDPEILADVRFAETALMAMAATHMHFGADNIARFDGGNFVSKALDYAAEFVT